ncbi:MAG: acyltransferase family protein [Promethearchaeota archaeon]
MKDIKTTTVSAIEKPVKKALEDIEGQYFQIDFLKAAMIFLVIFDHMVAWVIKSEIGVTLWERISIPVFLVLMGFNMGNSFQKKGLTTLKELYSWSYFKSKILRYIVPFLVLYGFSTLIGLILYQFNVRFMYYGQYYPQHGLIQLFTGILPFWGPGNWFIPVILGSIIILPLIYWAFTKKPVLSLILCFVVEIALQLTVFFFINEITSWKEVHIIGLFMNSFPFYLSAIGLGLWFSFNRKVFSNFISN